MGFPDYREYHGNRSFCHADVDANGRPPRAPYRREAITTVPSCLRDTTTGAT